MAARRSLTRSHSTFSRDRTIDSRIRISICARRRCRMPASRSSDWSMTCCCSLSRSRARSGSLASRFRAARSFTAVSCSRPWARTRRIASSSASSPSGPAEASRLPGAAGSAGSNGRAPLSATPGGGRSSGLASSWRSATSRINEASVLSGSRRSDASASRMADEWAPVASACRDSTASVAASPRIMVWASASPSRPSNGRNTPLVGRAFRASSAR